jgi:hypothetical protein
VNGLAACVLVLAMVGGLQACCVRKCVPDDVGAAPAVASDALAGTLRITRWGPTRTQAGVPFNTQRGIHAALWIRVDRPLDGDSVLVQFGDAFLEGQPSGGLVTAVVPPEAYARPGDYEVRVVARSGDSRWESNKVVFTVQ